jgi:hypothetical protein
MALHGPAFQSRVGLVLPRNIAKAFTTQGE